MTSRSAPAARGDTPGPVNFRAYVGLGGNLGDAHETLEAALAALQAVEGVQVEAVSSAYGSRPVDADGPDYVNAVASVQSVLGPLELLHALQAIEWQYGRERPYRHAPRTLDLDLLLYDSARRHSAELTLPHPRWAERAFVLEPLAELVQVLGDVVTAMPDRAERARLAALQGIEKSPRALHFK
ncbi:MAG TPA: 2-amino-4-hydroxy-6-hydroxymethyldihydropteridine diphosphokinase [Aquabacterium sp.]|nr:2-amino-4-hydroxy-6-hydroxymethyldihydropteridine diphosphokinase [Aquabacterium sp.]